MSVCTCLQVIDWASLFLHSDFTNVGERACCNFVAGLAGLGCKCCLVSWGPLCLPGRCHHGLVCSLHYCASNVCAGPPPDLFVCLLVALLPLLRAGVQNRMGGTFFALAFLGFTSLTTGAPLAA